MKLDPPLHPENRPALRVFLNLGALQTKIGKITALVGSHLQHIPTDAFKKMEIKIICDMIDIAQYSDININLTIWQWLDITERHPTLQQWITALEGQEDATAQELLLKIDEMRRWVIDKKIAYARKMRSEEQALHASFQSLSLS